MRQCGLLVFMIWLWSGVALAATDPTLPTATVDTTMPAINGTTYHATCSTLQAQMDAAAAANSNLNHKIVLAVGTLCTGPYVMPAHVGTGWIVIEGANTSKLPAGIRVGVAQASLMPVIQYGEDGALIHVGCFSAASNARRYRLVGIYCKENQSIQPNWAMVTLGYASTESTGTGYIILDRMLIVNNNSTVAAKATAMLRGVYGDADLGHTAIVDSTVLGIAHTEGDSQAWLSVSNPGPILIQNNYMQATGENFMLCGATPVNAAHQPQNVTIRHNLFSKDLAWAGSSGFMVKTLGELKCGSKVLIEANTFENMPGNDGGFTFRLTPRNEDYARGLAGYLEVSDVTIRYNTIRNVANFINTFGSDDGDACGSGVSACNTKHSKRFKIHDNLIYGLGRNCIDGADCGTITYFTTGGGGANGMNLKAGVRGGCTDPFPTCKHEDWQFIHNTIDLSGSGGGALLPITSDGMITLDYKDNLINCQDCAGIYDHGAGTSGSRGVTRLNEAVSGPGRVGPAGWVVTNNRIANGGSAGDGFAWTTSTMPPGNTYVSRATNFQWVNPCTTAGICSGIYDYTLQPGSPAKNAASDGTDQGVRWNLFNAAQKGGVTPEENVRSTPTPP